MHPVTLAISLTLTQVQPFQTSVKEIKNEESSYQYKDSFKEAKNYEIDISNILVYKNIPRISICIH